MDSYRKALADDIMIVQISKEELKQKQEGIIIEKEENLYLNPSYIKGFVKVNKESRRIVDFVDNPVFMEKGTEKERKEKS